MILLHHSRGELSAAGELWIKTIRQVIQEHVSPAAASRLTIELSSFEQNDSLKGSAVVAIDSILNQPSRYLAMAEIGIRFLLRDY